MRKWLLFFLIGILSISVIQVQAANFNVNGAATLIAAINTANSNGEDDVITLTANITLSAVDNATNGDNGLPSILPDGGNSLTIEGAGFTIQRAGSAPQFRIFHLSAGAELNLYNLTIQNGSATLGGAIYNLGTVTMSNSTLSGNTTSDDGGGIYNNAGTVTMSNNSTLSGNTATDDGGGVFNFNGTMMLNNSTVSGNMAGDLGGGIINIGGTVTLNDSTVSGNMAPDDGGGIYNTGTVMSNNSIVSGNTAGDFGGGIYNNLGTVTLSNSTLSSNLAIHGGAIYNLGTVTMSNSTLSGNTTSDDGGGIYNNAGTVTMSNSTLSGNTATDDGGGVFNFNGTMMLNNSTVSGNMAGDLGGGIINITSTMTLSNSTLSGNTAGDDGGGIFNTGTVTLNNSIISGNDAADSGIECELALGTFTANANNIFGTGGNNGGCTGGTVLAGAIGTLLDTTLTDNGGPTETHALVLGSAAIDASGGGATASDQRGAPAVGTRDIGAYEYDGVLQTVSFTIDETTLTEAGVIIQATVTITVTNYNANFDVSFGFSGTADSGDYTTSYAGSYTITGNGDTTFTIDIVDDVLVENPENLSLTLLVIGSADILNPNPQRIRLISDEAPPVLVNEPAISVFDPAISKIGFLVPGQVGVTGEQLEWIVTVTNTGSVIGQNVTVSDTLLDALQIDSVDAPNANVTINGQTVTVVYPTLNAGESVQFSIFTTVLDGVSVSNTACVNASNQGAEECATGRSVKQLPNTGEIPFWQNWILLAGGLLVVVSLSASFGIVAKKR